MTDTDIKALVARLRTAVSVTLDDRRQRRSPPPIIAETIDALEAQANELSEVRAYADGCNRRADAAEAKLNSQNVWYKAEIRRYEKMAEASEAAAWAKAGREAMTGRDVRILVVACELAGDCFRQNKLSGHGADWINKNWETFKPLASRIVDTLEKLNNDPARALSTKGEQDG